MKIITYVGRDYKKYEILKSIANEETIIVFMEDGDEHKASLERTRKKAEFWAKVLNMPVLAESSTINKEKKAVLFLSYIEPNCTKIASVATDKVSIKEACIKGFEAIKCHM